MHPGEPARFIVATDWSSPTHVMAALRAYALLGRGSHLQAVIAVPHEPTREDEGCVRAVMERLPVEVTGDLSVESFAEVRGKTYESAIVPQGDVGTLSVQIADWVTTLALMSRHTGLPTDQGSAAQLAALLTGFREQAPEPEPVTSQGPSWHGTYVGGGRILAALRTGGRAYLPADNRATTANVMQTGLFEPELHAYIHATVPTGGLAIDVGANIGLITIALAHAVKSPGRVIALEPVPSNVKFLRWNVQTNWLMDIVDVRECAASDGDGQVVMTVSDEWNSLGSIVPRDIEISRGHKAERQHSLQVNTVALDDLLRNETRVDIVKVDVEGAEHLVFRGMEELLDRQVVERVAFECMREHMAEAWTDFMDMLREREGQGWTFGVPRVDGDVDQIPVSAIEAAQSFRCVVMEKPGLRPPIAARRI